MNYYKVRSPLVSTLKMYKLRVDAYVNKFKQYKRVWSKKGMKKKKNLFLPYRLSLSFLPETFYEIWT